MTTKTVTPSTVKGVLDALQADPPLKAGHTHARGQFAVYRGCGSASWRLDSSLTRTGGDLAAKERRILDEFVDKANQSLRSHGIDPTVDLQLMSFAQHHGVPTRLLDWSRSHEPALHFATFDQARANEDGAVWVVNVNCVHEQLSEPARLSMQCERTDDPGIIRLDNVVATYPTISAFDSYFAKGKYEPIIFFEPVWTIQRIVAQGSIFSVVADAATSASDVLERLNGPCKKVIIKASLKEELRAYLDDRGAHEAHYYADTDGIGAYLARHWRE